MPDNLVHILCLVRCNDTKSIENKVLIFYAICVDFNPFLIRIKNNIMFSLLVYSSRLYNFTLLYNLLLRMNYLQYIYNTQSITLDILLNVFRATYCVLISFSYLQI